MMENIAEIKKAETSREILDVISKRFSPRAFRPQSLTSAELETLIEAASWAPSAMNEQPWRFVTALRDEEENFAKLVEYLLPGNRAWAHNAGAMLLILGKKSYTRNGQANVNVKHDVGLATMNLLLQAVDMDIYGHLMEGFEKQRVIDELGLGDKDLVPVTMLALGRRDAADTLEEPYLSRELARRSRKPLQEIMLEIL